MGGETGQQDIGFARAECIVRSLFPSSIWVKWISAALIVGIAFSVPVSARLNIPLLSRPAQQKVQTYGLGDWRLTIVTSIFSGEIQCRLATKRGEVFYLENALGFRFDDDANTLEAWVRIDAEPVQRWRDMLPALAAQRTAVDGKNLDAPTDGIIWLPSAAVEQAERVTIQLNANKRSKLFSLARFAELREAAQQLGCAPEARFIR